jgi:hypothetical protein
MNLGAVGSVAHHFHEDFLNIAEKFDFNNIYLTQKPIEDLENFHLNR